MSNQEFVRRSIAESLIIVSEIATNPSPFDPEFTGVLIGADGLLDSLETVTLLINIEEKLNLELGRHINVTARMFELLDNSFTKNELETAILEMIQNP
jgi:hypothetical protein